MRISKTAPRGLAITGRGLGGGRTLPKGKEGAALAEPTVPAKVKAPMKRQLAAAG